MPPWVAVRLTLTPRALLRLALRGGDADAVDVAEADGGAAALQVIEAGGVDIALIEIQMQEALALIASLRGLYPELVIAVCSFRTGSVIERLALEAGADAYIRKPVRREDLTQLAAERMGEC